MGKDGELALQGWVLALGLPEPLVCLDVGANIGDWSAALVGTSVRLGKKVVIHAFEPTPETFILLNQRLGGLAGCEVHAHHLAVTDRQGDIVMHVLGPSLGRNSVFPPMTGGLVTPETVAATSIDAFIERNGIQTLHLVKCDTEGHDPLVLQGARRAFEQERIQVFQFEYNERWIQARWFLWDVFRFIEGLPYKLGRLGPDGIEWISSWHPEVDRFFEANYVLAHRSVAERVPGVFGHFDRFNTYTRRGTV